MLIPYLMIGTSKLVFFLQTGRRRVGWLVVVLALWTAGSSLAAYPHSLSYLNEAAAGPSTSRPRCATAASIAVRTCKH